MHASRNIEARLLNHSCRGKAIIFNYSQCVSVALVIQHAKRMPHVLLSSVTCLTIIHYCIKGTIFEKEKLLDIKCVF